MKTNVTTGLCPCKLNWALPRSIDKDLRNDMAFFSGWPRTKAEQEAGTVIGPFFRNRSSVEAERRTGNLGTFFKGKVP